VNRLDDDRTFANGGGNALDRAATNIANGENTGEAGLIG
jgi:hypothetical protein